ncbi:tetratricopeptide repeat protein [Acaryochloris marina]|uniref:tetratricopeptide repeat protein n=1 Tax=Acaryochloris marina TaxID=155978 RepID=UPI001BAF7E18|nr:tetratricopeptide repeat protein [Acaryochloris marina]QUY45678.1 tetratricopeptide repeat protein [Acaryochloris marina S15]
MQDLHQLLQKNNPVALTALAGMGGIGKTELALQYAISQLDQGQYPGGLCWLRVKGQALAAQIIEFARTKLALALPDGLNEDQQVSYIWGQWPTGKVLIIFDDVKDLETIEPYLPPSDPRYKVLITTRQDLGLSDHSLSIKELSDTSALSLLRTLVGADRIDAQLDDAQALCGWVGKLPLGLELVGRYLARKPDWSLQKLIKRLESKRLQAKALTTPASGMTAQFGVAAALELSWVELNEAEQELACFLGMFAVAPIPWTLVEGCLSEQDKDDLEDIRDEGLKDRNLLKRIEESTYQLHQIVQEFFRIKLNEDSEQGKSLKAAYCRGMVAVAQGINQNPTIDVIAGMSASIPHLEELIRQWIDHLGDDELMWPYVGIGRFYEGQGNYALALPWYQKCLEQTQQRLGNEHTDVATSLNNLAGLYKNQGRYEEAEPLYTQALQMRQKPLGNEHPDVATSLNNLALLYDSQGRYEEAEPLYTQALQMTQKLLGNEHPDVALSLNNLAGLYDNQGRYEEAEPLYTQALQMKKKLLGNEHPSVASSLNNLAGLYKNQGRYEEAEPLYTQALQMTQKLLGNEHPSVASSLNNLAALYENQGRYEEAEPLYTQALQMRQKLLGNEHPYVATSLNNLAGLYKNQGRYEEAEPLYTQALQMTQKLLGNEHPSVASSLNNLAALYDNQGRYEEAEPLYTQALQMRQKLLGNEHPDVATSLNNLALLYDNQGRYEEAEPLYTQALQMKKKLLGNEHPSVASSLNNLAGLYKNQGRYEEAEPLYTQALQMRQKLLGNEHPSVATSLNNLALLYKNQGRYKEAKSNLKQALKIVEVVLGPEHPSTRTMRNNLESIP